MERTPMAKQNRNGTNGNGNGNGKGEQHSTGPGGIYIPPPDKWFK